jgi:hypothetical protein
MILILMKKVIQCNLRKTRGSGSNHTGKINKPFPINRPSMDKINHMCGQQWNKTCLQDNDRGLAQDWQ